MINMYKEEQGVEELLAADKLQSLIIATSSLWDQCSHSWKVPTGRVLKTISKALTKTSIVHLQGLFSNLASPFLTASLRINYQKESPQDR